MVIVPLVDLLEAKSSLNSKQFIADKIDAWLVWVDKRAWAAEKQPQAAYAAMANLCSLNGHLYSESYQTVNLLLLSCKTR